MDRESKKILFIEDDPSIRMNVAELLSIKGYHVEMAANGKDGISLARNGNPNLILCDMRMPDMNGNQVLEAIRNIPMVSHVPFLFLSGQVDTSDFHQAMNLKADDYLTKPFQFKDLLTAINSQLNRHH